MIAILLSFVAIAADALSNGNDKCIIDSSLCGRNWPGASCINGTCECATTQLKRETKSGWVCLNLIDSSTGSFGPPLTCPLPSGSGFKVVARNGTDVLFCSTMEEHCPDGYECIGSLHYLTNALPAGTDGVCCPTKRLACAQPVFAGSNPTLSRWFFDGRVCAEFKWDLLAISGQTANNFETKEHCESYCL